MSSPLVVQFGGKTYAACVVIDSVVGGTSSGGVRIVPGITQEEVADLAREMTLKYSLFRLPRGGAKMGIDLRPDLSPEERREALEAVGRDLAPLVWAGLYNPGMDMNCGPVELQALYRGAGITISHPTDTSFFTALTIAACVVEVGERVGETTPITLAIEGFGSVGYHLVRLLPTERFRVIAIATLAGAVRASGGFAASHLIEQREAHGDALVHHLGGEPTDRRGVLLENADVLLPSSRTHVVSKALVRDVRARAIVPIANAPYDTGAVDALHEKGILCLPGFFANSGGVFASSLYDSGVPREEVEHLFTGRFGDTVALLLTRAGDLGISVVEATETIARAEAERRSLLPAGSTFTEKVRRRLNPYLPRGWRASRARKLGVASLDALDADISALGRA